MKSKRVEMQSEKIPFCKKALFVGSFAGLVVGITSFALLFFFGQSFFATQTFLGKELRASTLGKNSFTFINPLLGFIVPKIAGLEKYKTVQQSVSDTITAAKNKGQLQTVTVYFRNLTDGTWFDTNQTETYSPASLLKIPTMIAYFKAAETNPGILSQKITYTGIGNENIQENIISPMQMKEGETYTVEELIERMIRYSDNNAATLLIAYMNDHVDYHILNEVYTDLGIDSVTLGNDFITARAYSLFFRVLYNATYLNRDMSEKALRLLSETDFTKGIRATVPEGVLVSHKFGEFSVKDTQGTLLKRELHDCGIVYVPNAPYLLCIMSKGNDFNALEAMMQSVSKTVYDYVATGSKTN